MKCLRPLKASRDADSNITFNPNNGQILLLPCGQCINCRLQQSQDKALRMVHESQFHEENCFITLTYSDEHLPQNYSFNYQDVTDFIKRFRDKIYPRKISYYRVGEYGDETQRPHYHLCLFGYDFTRPEKYKSKTSTRELLYTNDGNHHYKSQFLDDLWDKGICELTDFNFSTAMYVAKYVLKKN